MDCSVPLCILISCQVGEEPRSARIRRPQHQVTGALGEGHPERMSMQMIGFLLNVLGVFHLGLALLNARACAR